MKLVASFTLTVTAFVLTKFQKGLQLFYFLGSFSYGRTLLEPYLMVANIVRVLVLHRCQVT